VGRGGGWTESTRRRSRGGGEGSRRRV